MLSFQVGIGFDTAFVFTEVNADVVVYVKDPASSWGFRKSDHFDLIGRSDGYVCACADDNVNADLKVFASSWVFHQIDKIYYFNSLLF